MPGGSLIGGVVITGGSPLSAQAKTVASEESHASWYAVPPYGKQPDVMHRAMLGFVHPVDDVG
jgi:hypothetical protein